MISEITNKADAIISVRNARKSMLNRSIDNTTASLRRMAYRCKDCMTEKQLKQATMIVTLLDDFNIQAKNVISNVFQTNCYLQYASEILGYEEVENAFSKFNVQTSALLDTFRKLVENATDNPNVLFKIDKVFEVFKNKFFNDSEIILISHHLARHQAKHMFDAVLIHKNLYLEDKYMKLSQFLTTSHKITSNEIIDYTYKKYTNDTVNIMTQEEFDKLKQNLITL